ncbi:MAG: DUF2079 domain-containing protein, partial [Chloroflexi bacterium]|nr:DUF2079 domain-containing protein [Chloroflexota bacterium]
MRNRTSQAQNWARMRNWRRLATPGLALFLLLLGWYVLTMSGHTYANDEETMLAVGDSLLTTGSFAISPDLPLTNRTTGVDGRSYSRYGPAQSVAVVPFLAAGRALGASAPEYAGLIQRLFVLLLPALVTAATGLVLYAWVRMLGYPLPIALLVGLLYGLTSLAWPYSRTLFAEPLATFFLLLAAYGLRRDHQGWWVVAGAALAGALAAKFQTA